jgi:murein L,D-transpeptidase YafK
VFRFICSYPVLGASGLLGPKLREGDRQVPEGVYRVPELNPNSDFHLSIRLNYPNEFDQAKAATERRTSLGGDIMIHGDSRSRGCLAMGDPAAEDLFVLVALTGIGNVTVILTPVDFRGGRSPELPAGTPTWTPELYERIKRELARYPRPSRQ